MKTNSSNTFLESLFVYNIFSYLCIAFFCCFSNAAFSQTFPSSCSSKDLSLVSATLTGGDPCNSCTPGQMLTRTLVLGINNKTGSLRTAFAFWATLEVTHQDGTVTTSSINRCAGPVPPTGPLPAFYNGGNFGTITYQCGDALRLLDLHLAWTDASPNSTCATINSATINPKCGVLPSIVVAAGVNGAFSVTAATCTTNGSIAVSPFGGKAPYSVSIGATVNSNIAAGATSTFTNLAPASYTVIITDANNCVISFVRTINAPPALGVPAATPTHATCTVSTGSAAVTSPVAGITYTLRQNGAIMHTANASGQFSNVPVGTYALVATLGTCTMAGSDITINGPTQIGVPAAIPSHPTCTVSTGSCAVTAPVAGITYTLRQNGAIMHTANANGQFSNVPTGTYALVATLGSCTRAGNDITINAQPPTPDAPEVCVVQPSLCGPSTGSVTITSPLGAGYEYSVNNGSTWQSSPVFNNLAAGSVTGIKTRKDGCVSVAASCDDSSCSEARMAQTAEEPKAPIAAETEKVGFDVFPVPFKDVLTIKYNFDYKTDVKIEVFNSLGTMLLTKTDRDAQLGEEITLDVNFHNKDLLYFVRVTTNRGSNVRTIISD